MFINTSSKNSISFFASLFIGLLISFTFTSKVFADALPANVQTKVDTYKKILVEWAANPAIIQAAKAANLKGPAAGMGNAKWADLDEKDPVVLSYQNSEAGALVTKLDNDKGISKLYLRDDKGNIVASSNKPLLFNNGSKPWVASPLKDGKPFSTTEIKPDPATQVKGVHLGVPVMSDGKAIGVLHTSVIAE